MPMRIALITRTEFGWAAFLALAFAIIVDFFSIGSRLRSGARHIKNRLAERSAEKIKERIKALEKRKHPVMAVWTCG